MNTLQVNPTTGEVFLRLPAPHENVIITTPRESDKDDIVLMLNDPRIYKFLLSPPFPYQTQHAEAWLRTTKKKSDELLEDLHEGKAVVDGCPVQYIRETRSDGTDLLLGDVTVGRNGWLEISDEEQRAKMAKENLEKPVGDHSIVWTIGGVSKAQSNMRCLVMEFRRLSSAQPPRKGDHVRSSWCGDQPVDGSPHERPQNPDRGHRREHRECACI